MDYQHTRFLNRSREVMRKQPSLNIGGVLFDNSKEYGYDVKSIRAMYRKMHSDPFIHENSRITLQERPGEVAFVDLVCRDIPTALTIARRFHPPTELAIWMDKIIMRWSEQG